MSEAVHEELQVSEAPEEQREPAAGKGAEGRPRPADPVVDILSAAEEIGVEVRFSDLTPLHGRWIREMVLGTEDYTLQAHRAAYKSSCLAVAISLMMIIEPRKNIIFVRKADNDVSEMLRMVAKILRTETFARLCRLLYHGLRLAITEEASDHLSTNLWTSPMGSPQLLGIGMKASITGKHAAVVITDDICNITDRLSRAERERTKMQYQELQNIRNRGGRIINLGTPWHREDVFSLMPNIHRYDCYHTGLISKEELARIRASMSPSLFAANYELLHIASGEAMFESTPPTGADPALLRDGCAHIDAAYGGEDYTAFTAAKREENTIYLYGRLWRKHVDQVLPEILAEADRLVVAPVYVETNGDKGFLEKEIKQMDHWARGYPETENKLIKISTHLRKWWPHIVFVEGTDPEYINQILDYTENAEHDDAPDSAACLCRILGKHWW